MPVVLVASAASSGDTTKTSYTGREVLDEVLPHFGCYVYFDKGDLLNVYGADLRKGDMIVEVTQSNFSFRDIELPFGSSGRLSANDLALWLSRELGASNQLIKEVLTNPAAVRERSCAAKYRYELPKAIYYLYPQGVSRDHVCRTLDALGYELQYNGLLTKLGDLNKTSSKKRSLEELLLPSYVWKKGSSVAPWETVHHYAAKAKWTKGMLITYLERYVQASAKDTVAALQSTEKESKVCGYFYPEKVGDRVKRALEKQKLLEEKQKRLEEKQRRQLERQKLSEQKRKAAERALKEKQREQREQRGLKPPIAEYYRGSDVILKILPYLNAIPHKLVGGELVRVAKPNDFKSGDTLYRVYRTHGYQPKPFQVPFGPDSLLSKSEVGGWLRNKLGFSGTSINKVFK